MFHSWHRELPHVVGAAPKQKQTSKQTNKKQVKNKNKNNFVKWPSLSGPMDGKNSFLDSENINFLILDKSSKIYPKYDIEWSRNRVINLIESVVQTLHNAIEMLWHHNHFINTVQIAYISKESGYLQADLALSFSSIIMGI